MQKQIILTILPPFWPKMPPLGIAYLQAYLADKKIKADIMDINNVFYNLADNKLKKAWLISCNTFLEENIINIIQKDFPSEFDTYINKMLGYDIVGFSCFKSNLKTTLEVIKVLKARKNDIKIILGGPEITRQYFKTNGHFNMGESDNSLLQSDKIIIGEGERPLYNFIVMAQNPSSTNSAPRPYYDKISKFDQLENLEDLPYPKFNNINAGSYPRKDAVPVKFSRGCVRKCNFCSEKLLYKGFRSRPVISIIDEIEFHLKNGIKYFIFFDSMLNADLNKFNELLDVIIRRLGNIHWETQLAVRNDMKTDLFTKMKQSGCYNLFIGLESGSDNTLKRMNKGFTTKEAAGFFRKLKEAGLFFGISIITGYPGETEKDFRESLDFVIQNKDIIPKIEQINPFTYYDGTNTDEKADYKSNMEAIRRMELFINEIKKNGFKYTNAYLGNLIEKIY